MQNQAKLGLKWSAIDRYSTQLIQLIILLYLAKKLGPDTLGLIGLITIFLALSNVFSDSGLSSALIRKLDRSEVDFSTTFYFNFFVGLTCYLIVYATSPFIAQYFQQPELESITKVLGLTIIINSLSIVQKSKLTIKVDFKTQAKTSLISTIFGGIVGVTLTLYDFGAWALVFRSIASSSLQVILLFFFQPWIPKYRFNFSAFSGLFKFGYKLLISSIIDTLHKNIYPMIIGKNFSISDVGHYTQAHMITSAPSVITTSVIQSVSYPILCQLQNSPNKLEEAFFLTLRLSALLVFPAMFCLSTCASPIITLLLGEDWLPSANMISILSLGVMLYPVHSINLTILKVKGRSDLFLQLEIIKTLLVICVLFITIPLGIKAICIGMVVQSYLSLIINTFYTKTATNISLLMQFKRLLPIWCLAGLSSYFSYWIVHQLVIQNAIILLVVEITLTIIFYILFVRILFKELFFYMFNKNNFSHREFNDKQI